MTPSPGIEPGPHWWEASALPLRQPCSMYTKWPPFLIKYPLQGRGGSGFNQVLIQLQLIYDYDEEKNKNIRPRFFTTLCPQGITRKNSSQEKINREVCTKFKHDWTLSGTASALQFFFLKILFPVPKVSNS